MHAAHSNRPSHPTGDRGTLSTDGVLVLTIPRERLRIVPCGVSRARVNAVLSSYEDIRYHIQGGEVFVACHGTKKTGGNMRREGDSLHDKRVETADPLLNARRIFSPHPPRMLRRRRNSVLHTSKASNTSCRHRASK